MARNDISLATLTLGTKSVWWDWAPGRCITNILVFSLSLDSNQVSLNALDKFYFGLRNNYLCRIQKFSVNKFQNNKQGTYKKYSTC